MNNTQVRQVLSRLVAKYGARHVSEVIGCDRYSVVRYESGERPVIPFATGWAILAMASRKRGACPDIPAKLARLCEGMTHKEAGVLLGLDGDTVGSYISRKRKRIPWDVGRRVIALTRNFR